MDILNTLRFIAGVGLLLVGLCFFITEMIGVFKFKYVLNRMHAAGMGDTIGLSVTLLGTMILSGFNFTTLKMALIIVFLWMASPVASHLIARLEVTTNEELEKYCKLPEDMYAEKSKVSGELEEAIADKEEV